MAVMRLPGLFGGQYLAVSRDTRTFYGAERLRHVVAMRWTRGFHTLGASIS
jgi:hypothetical protein